MAASTNDAPVANNQPATEQEVTVEREEAAAAAAAAEEERLRYMEFVQQAAVQALVLAATAYAYGKQGAGPLRPNVDHVEGTVKAVVGTASTVSRSTFSSSSTVEERGGEAKSVLEAESDFGLRLGSPPPRN